MKRSAILLTAALAAIVALGACGSDDKSATTTVSPTTVPSGAASTDASTATSTAASTATSTAASTAATTGTTAAAESADSVTLVAYDSFAVDPSVFDSFTAATGISVSIVTAGDAGTMLSKAALTAGNPEGDVMWGVDNTLLARALASDVFEPYTSPELSSLAAEATALVPGHEATPVDEGDVCVNYDIAWFESNSLPVPATLEDLTDPKYKDLLVVENPATSSPGLAFMLATIAEFGDTGNTGGWQQYWKDLRANGVEVVDSWDIAYQERFSGSAGKGPRPLVVSYGSSPPVEVIYGDPVPETAPTGVLDKTCFHQVEFAGILRGTKHAESAGKLIDFLVSKEFQEQLPLALFVYPVREGTALPPEWVRWAVRPAEPLKVAPDEIEQHSEEWITTWTDLVVR
jgi:thiamine transport system substrate-binding protein